MRAARPRRAARWSDLELALRHAHGELLAGVDEVGRGPLAGPVVACAVVMPPDAPCIAGVDDSKALTPAVRETLAAEIRRTALAVGIGAVSAREVDALNVYHATTRAMQRALAQLAGRLGRAPDHVLVDGKPIRALGVAHDAVVGGDAVCYAIGCASIVAKVTRDRLMRALAARHPAYAWERNMGYGTAVHRDALRRVGTTAHHRRSFLGAIVGEPAR